MQTAGQMAPLALAAVDTLYAVPFMSCRSGTVDRLGFEVTIVGGAGSKTRAGIYTSSGLKNLYPKTLVVDGGEFDTSSGANVKAAVISQLLLPNTLYWFVILSGTATPTVRGVLGPDVWPILGYPSTLGANPQTLLSVAQAYGTLPSTFPAGATAVSSTIPQIAVRYST